MLHFCPARYTYDTNEECYCFLVICERTTTGNGTCYIIVHLCGSFFPDLSSTTSGLTYPPCCWIFSNRCMMTENGGRLLGSTSQHSFINLKIKCQSQHQLSTHLHCAIWTCETIRFKMMTYLHLVHVQSL